MYVPTYGKKRILYIVHIILLFKSQNLMSSCLLFAVAIIILTSDSVSSSNGQYYVDLLMGLSVYIL